MLTPEQKKYRDRANRARRELFKEKETFGAARDGSGKRYRVCVYYVMSGAPEKAVEFLQWFSEEFPDDVGEPVFLLHAALAYRRTGQQQPATRYLVDAMLSNLYLLPYLYGKPLARQDIWHSSNWSDTTYIAQVDDLLDTPTGEERMWFKSMFESELFTALRNYYIETFHALLDTRDVEQRQQLLEQWHAFYHVTLGPGDNTVDR